MYIPEYLYSFSFGSCDWRMYTIFAGVFGLCCWTRAKVGSFGQSVARTRRLFWIFPVLGGFSMLSINFPPHLILPLRA